MAVVGAHHEKFDGSGYPKRIHGAEIPITARHCCTEILYPRSQQNRRSQSGTSGLRLKWSRQGEFGDLASLCSQLDRSWLFGASDQATSRWGLPAVFSALRQL